MAAEWAAARRVDEIDWSSWQAVDTATLVFVIEGERILLIEKKRGLGGGKVNGPGGKLDPGESVEACAIRECREELGIAVSGLTQLGEHRFQFTNGYSIHCFAFRTSEWEGPAVETPEAAPLWTPIDAIPWQRMWADDRLWLPLLIAGQAFTARWIFEDDTMLDYQLDLIDAAGQRRVQA